MELSDNKNGTKVCRRCLLDDLDEDDFFRSLKEYIAEYPQEKRCPEEEYSRRLDICTGCDDLTNGMCRLCGCYVEVRALKKISGCPAPEKKW